MFTITTILSMIYLTECANLQRYSETTSRPSFTTLTNMYDRQQVYKTGSYGSDIASFPPVSRYPEYNTGYSSSYNTYNGGLNNVYQQPGFDAGSGDTYGKGYSSYEMPFMNDIRSYCVNRSPQTGIWVDNLMGMWYGVEFIQHLAGDSRVDYARSCIVIHLSEPKDRPSTENQLYHVQHINAKFRQEYRHLRLLWDEAGHTSEYSLYFRNDSAGYWQVFEGQNGTLPLRPNFQQFSGTVQVLKAVNDHLVLNFCQEAANGRQAQLYSVLFSRDPGNMARWELDAVHTMLQNKKLSVASRRMVCGNGAGRAQYGVMLSILAYILAYALSS